MALQSIGDLAQSFVIRRQGTQLVRDMDRLTREVSTGRPRTPRNICPVACCRWPISSGRSPSPTRIAMWRASPRWMPVSCKRCLVVCRTAPARSPRRRSPPALAGGAMQPDVLAQGPRVAVDDDRRAQQRLGGPRALRRRYHRPTAAGQMRRPCWESCARRSRRPPIPPRCGGRSIPFFDTPGGGFATAVYRGGQATAADHVLGAGETVALRIRADDAALRDQIKQAAMLSLLDDPTLALAMRTGSPSRVTWGQGFLAGRTG